VLFDYSFLPLIRSSY